jgi:hypothetical protein
MQAIAEAAWLLQSNRWAFGIFGPRYFSDTSFDARGGGLSIVGVGVAQADEAAPGERMSVRKITANGGLLSAANCKPRQDTRPRGAPTLLALADKLKQHLRPGRQPRQHKVAGGATPGSSA